MTKCVLLKNKKTKESRGFGFIDFAIKDSASQCLAINEHYCDGRKFNCKEAFTAESACRREEEEQAKKLWLGSLDPEWSESVLRDYFSQFGEVETSYIAREKGSEISRKFGFLFYKNKEPVAKTLEVPVHVIEGVEIEVKALKSRRTATLKPKVVPPPKQSLEKEKEKEKKKEKETKKTKKVPPKATPSDCDSTNVSNSTKCAPGNTSIDLDLQISPKLGATLSEPRIHKKLSSPISAPSPTVEVKNLVPVQKLEQDSAAYDQDVQY